MHSSGRIGAVRSLASQSKRQLLLLGVVIFLGLVLLVISFSFYQFDYAINSYVRVTATSLEKRVASDPEFVLPNEASFSAHKSWDTIPIEIRELFNKDSLVPSEPVDAERINANGEREYVTLIFSNSSVGNGIYVVEIEDAEAIDTLILALVEKTIVDASLMIGVFSILFFLVIAGLFQNSLKPLNLLVDWSRRIKQNPDQEQQTHFSITELNDIAEDLLESLKEVKEYNHREQQFLKHASHEMRTPLAILQASIDTLNVRTPEGHESYPALKRAERASGNMILLSEALLWLARKSDQPIQRSRFEPAALCHELAGDLNYLIKDKSVDVRVNDHSSAIELEYDLCRIALANLIRNAFQHSTQGLILISMNENSFSVANPIEPPTETMQNSSSQSFGLGLQLVERIAEKLNWQFEYEFQQRKAFVSLRWNS